MPGNSNIYESFYKHLLENSHDAVLIFDKSGVVNCNKAAVILFESSRESLIGRSLEFFAFPEITENEKSGNSIKWCFKLPSGKEIRSELCISSALFEKERFFQVVIKNSHEKVYSSITENALNNLILNIFPGLFFIYDVTEGFDHAYLLRFNSRWYHEKLGYATNAIPASYPDFLFSPDETSKTKSIINILENSKNADFEINIRHNAGFDIPYLFVANLIETDRKFFTGVGIDISERKYTESALRQSEEYFKNIFNTSSDGILVLDSHHKILNANKAMLRMFEYKFEDIAFQNVLDYIPEPAHKLILERAVQLFKNEATAPLEIEVRKSSGATIPIEINSIPIKYADKKGILTTVRDLTERKMLEKQIFNSEIMSEERERERFAKELHDGLGPILSTCKIYLHSLNEMLSQENELLKISGRALSLLDDALVSIKEISNNLSPHVLRNFGLVQAVIAFTHNLENISDLKFEVHYNYDERLDEVVEFTAYRIVTELINNSIKYAEAAHVKIDINLDRPFLNVSYRDAIYVASASY
ncbi:MAG TPA: PAS domain S-box protein [Bacteroidales bacterium]|nr:PAS domain S-box protein [Bacteroidales bacterium]